MKIYDLFYNKVKFVLIDDLLKELDGNFILMEELLNLME